MIYFDLQCGGCSLEQGPGSLLCTSKEHVYQKIIIINVRKLSFYRRFEYKPVS